MTNAPQIKLYNSLTHKKEPFAPLNPQQVRVYVCGPTVYDRAHIGNARTVVVFDMLFRLLREIYGAAQVTYARNYTDVDDKIIARADETGEPIDTITRKTIEWYEQDMAALGALDPDEKPRATEYIKPMQTMIAELIAKGFAYAVSEGEGAGHVLFDVRAHKNYGVLSRRSLDDMRAGARVEVAAYKRDPMDFVLWKPSADTEPGWDSPWGRGRPGWHIECSAMARDLFGETFDIHGGGLDLQFPHHENEIAQSCACCGTQQLAQVWMHNEMLQVEGKKMSKSLGNFFTVRDLLEQGYHGAVIRYVYLMTHYRKPMDWSADKAEEAKLKLQRWQLLASQSASEEGEIYQPVLDALADDLNTPLALSAMDELANEARDNESARAKLLGSLELLGFEKPLGIDGADEYHIKALLDERKTSRMKKDFEKSDWIRDGLEGAGVIIEDGTAEGWRVSLSFNKNKLADFVAAYRKKYPSE